ncbi:MAG: magnesium transporter CorA family protein [Pseudomonadota bacterium]
MTLLAYYEHDGALQLLPPDVPLSRAVWIDLLHPTAAESEAVCALGAEVPTLEDMQEIEISSRLYRDANTDYMTVVLTGIAPDGRELSSPVTFILQQHLLVTVRHYESRPFATYPTRAGKVGAGCGNANRIFLSLLDEIIGRIADHLEGVGRTLDQVARSVYEPVRARRRQQTLEHALRRVGRSGEFLGIIRLALLTLSRAVGFYSHTMRERVGDEGLNHVVKNLSRDLTELEVHTDFLSGRVGLASDATLGMINLEQSQTVRIVSVVAVLFVPPTLIASIYGMNFRVMPELDQAWGYPAALGLMLASAVIAWACFRWKDWL